MSKKYGLGVIVGRFQIVHKGHVQVIEEGIKDCEEFAILVGSAQEERTAKNPFSYKEREAVLKAAFPDAKVFPLPDIGVGNCEKWGDYVVAKVEEYLGRKPDVFYSGEEDRRKSWLDPGLGIKEVFVPKGINISSTQMKAFLEAGDEESWNKFSALPTGANFAEIRAIIAQTSKNTNTQSI